MGSANAKTPRPFVAACDKFVYLENLTYDQSATALSGSGGPGTAIGETGHIRMMDWGRPVSFLQSRSMSRVGSTRRSRPGSALSAGQPR
jgi:hypothetical protein